MYCPQVMHPQAMQKVFTQHYYSSTSHTRNRRATPSGNSIRASVPGLKNEVEIPFPDRKLPVCKRCKKIYKTRELCRVRDRHTEIPWSTTYICVTLDESCFTRNSSGEMKLVEEGPMRFVARSVTGPPATYRSKDNALGGTKSPICMACKDKNYTRHHCRVKNKHLEMPWGTVYVMLSAIPAAPGATGFLNDNDSISESSGSKRTLSLSDSNECEPSSKKSKRSGDEDSTVRDEDSETEAPKECITSDIHQIQSSKAFLLTVGKDDCILNWLDVDATVPQTESSSSWASEPPMDNMYQPPFYSNGNNNGPPPSWPGYGNNFMPNAPSSSHSSSMNMNNGPPMSNTSMSGGRSTPNDYSNQNYPPGPYGNDSNYSSQMGKPSMPPQGQMQFNPNSYPSYEDRENQGPLMNHQGPSGPSMSMGYPPNKPFQQQGPQNESGPLMNRASPVPPHGDYTNTNSNQSNTVSQPPYNSNQHHTRGSDQGYNTQSDYSRRDRLSGPPHPNSGGPYGGNGNGMPFYAPHHSNGPSRHP
uniref:Uncharacterized protein n=1 Tax=Chaetoceros debilis TaxID=122233 RepID=A0A7S3VAI8_9STRA